ncbi:transposase [Caballeronia novacaledonica]|uniref:transposase n=1 Tax=Caballeronia novacaledonica TaxID=1544861 RepID=UPI003857CFAC
MSVSIVARRHDINANVVFAWRKQYREGKLVIPALEAAPSVPSTKLLSVDVIDSALVLRPSESSVASQTVAFRRKGAGCFRRNGASERRLIRGSNGDQESLFLPPFASDDLLLSGIGRGTR